MAEFAAWAALLISFASPVLIFCGRTWLRSSIEGQVRLGVEQQIEAFRSELRHSEELMKSELRSKEAEIASLRDGALNGRINRMALIDKRRVEAAERLWKSMTKLASLKNAAFFLSMIEIDNITNIVEKDPNLRLFLETSVGHNFEDKLRESNIEEERLFISDYCWALYSAYRAIISISCTSLKMLTAGIDDPKSLLKLNYVKNLLKAALPHLSDKIDNIDAGSFHTLLDEIEIKLLQEINKDLDGTAFDKKNISEARELLKHADMINKHGLTYTNTL